MSTNFDELNVTDLTVENPIKIGPNKPSTFPSILYTSPQVKAEPITFSISEKKKTCTFYFKFDPTTDTITQENYKFYKLFMNVILYMKPDSAVAEVNDLYIRLQIHSNDNNKLLYDNFTSHRLETLGGGQTQQINYTPFFITNSSDLMLLKSPLKVDFTYSTKSGTIGGGSNMFIEVFAVEITPYSTNYNITPE